MQTYRDLIELARISREQARATKDPAYGERISGTRV